MTEDDVDPENPRPEGHYPRFRNNEWHCVPDELAQTISLGPGGDGGEGQDWVLTYTPEWRNKEDRETVLVRLTPRALHELYVETKDFANDARIHGHSASAICVGIRSISTVRFRTRAESRVTNTVGQSTRVRVVQ